jgi:tRNA pseudouridine-54 N-methylase
LFAGHSGATILQRLLPEALHWSADMAQQIRLSVTFAWWLKPYLRVLAICCVLAGTLPDEAKLMAKIKRAMRLTMQ